MDIRHRLINLMTGLFAAFLALLAVTSLYIAVRDQSTEPLLFYWLACLVLSGGYWLLISTVAWLLVGRFAIWFEPSQFKR